MPKWDSSPAFSNAAQLSAAAANLSALNSLAGNATKLNSTAVTVAKIASMTTNPIKVNPALVNLATAWQPKVKPIKADIGMFKDLVSGTTKGFPSPPNLNRHNTLALRSAALKGWDSNSGAFRSFQQASSKLSQGQRGWLAKSIREWASIASGKCDLVAVEAKPFSSRAVPDLSTYLLFRHVKKGKERAGRGRIRDWFKAVYQATFPRLGSGFKRPDSAKELLASLKPPPGWTTAARFRCVLEFTIARILEQITTVRTPNAPSRLGQNRVSVLRGGHLVFNL